MRWMSMVVFIHNITKYNQKKNKRKKIFNFLQWVDKSYTERQGQCQGPKKKSHAIGFVQVRRAWSAVQSKLKWCWKCWCLDFWHDIYNTLFSNVTTFWSCFWLHISMHAPISVWPRVTGRICAISSPSHNMGKQPVYSIYKHHTH